MLGVAGAAKAVADGLGVVAAAIPFVKEIWPGQDEELSQVIEETRQEVIAAAREIDADIRQIRQTLGSCDLDMNMSLNQLNDEVGIFKHGICAIKVKAMRKKLNGIHQRIADLIDDLPQLLRCRERLDELKSASQSAYSRKKEIDENFSYNRPVGELLGYLAAVTAQIIAELGDDILTPVVVA